MEARSVSASLSLQQHAEWVEYQRFAESRAEVLRVVGGKLGLWTRLVDYSDLEDAYWQACLEVWKKRSGRDKTSNLTGLLVTITLRRMFDYFRKVRPNAYADIDLAMLGTEGDLAERLDQSATAHRVLARMQRDLNPQERRAVYLCEVLGYSRPEARKLLHLSEARMQRLMDGATKKIRRLVASIRARGCGEDEWARMLLAYARGELDESSHDHRRAQAHIQECDCCERYVIALQAANGRG
jgi:DNA-directed RNA polymerase specialized sigma24 family protein